MSTTVTIDPRFHDAVIFDLDGVVTDTASIHAAAWAALFNDFLQRRQASDDEDHSPFTDDDYRHFVDGKPRGDGVTDFLASRGISLPPGSASDSTEDTICGLGARKQEIFLEGLHAGVPVFESTVVLVRKLAHTGVAMGVYSSSRNCERILKDAGLGDLFTVRVDGVVAQDLGLPGKPDPAVLLETTRRLGAVPERSVVVEDAEAGVEAGSGGGFALVIGVDRTGHAEELRRHGADVVVPDLADVAVRTGDKRMSLLPNAAGLLRPADRCGGRTPAVCMPRLRWHPVGDRVGSRRGQARRRRGQGAGEPGGAVPGGHLERPRSGRYPRPGRHTRNLVRRQPWLRADRTRWKSSSQRRGGRRGTHPGECSGRTERCAQARPGSTASNTSAMPSRSTIAMSRPTAWPKSSRQRTDTGSDMACE